MKPPRIKNALEKIAALRGALVAARIEHHECDDSYYSCATIAPAKWGRDKVCDCGADAHNAAIDAVLEATR